MAGDTMNDTGTVTLPDDLKTQIQDELYVQGWRFDEQTHQGIDAAIRVFARLVGCPVPADAARDMWNPEGDSTQFQSVTPEPGQAADNAGR